MDKDKKLTREEKISHFDELRKNYCSLMKSLKFYEDECSKLTKTSSEQIPKSAVITASNNQVKDQNPSTHQSKWMNDPDLPSGWLYADQFTSQHSHVHLKHYKSPSGKTFQGIPQVLREFIKSGKGREPLMKCLKKEGWFETELLPPGHFMRQKRGEKAFIYLTSEAERFTTTVRMLKYLKEEYKWDKKLIDRFLNEHKSLYTEDALSGKPMAKIKLEKKTLKTKGATVDQEITSNPGELLWQPDIFLPDGWKVATTNHKNSSGAKRYMSPEGELHCNLSKALKHILLSGGVSDEQMEILKDGLEYDGWSKEAQLPDGWRVKRENDLETFLSPDLDLFSNKNEVFKYLIKSGLREEPEPFKGLRYKTLISKDIKSEQVHQTEWKTDSSLPNGWQSCWFASGEKSKFMKFKSPNGKIFTTRASATRRMIFEKYPNEDIVKMKKGFIIDGWVPIKDFPMGWMKQSTIHSYMNFLTPEYHMIKSCEIEKRFDQLNLDKNLIPLLREIKRDRLRESKAQNSTENIKEEWQDDCSLPSGWKICWDREPSRNHKFKTRSDRIIIGRSPAMRVMIAEKYSEEDLEKMKKGFGSDGWKKTVYLPPGWMKKEYSGVMLFLTPEFQVIKDENVDIFFDKYKLDKSLITMLKWEKSEEENIEDLLADDPEETQNFVPLNGLPKDWRAEINVSGKLLIFNPDGKQFLSRIEALQFMVQSNYDAKTIHSFWKSLEEEGWRVDDRIPSGWRVRRLNGDNNDAEYLSSKMTIISSTKEAMDEIKSSGNFEQIIKFEAFVENEKLKLIIK